MAFSDGYYSPPSSKIINAIKNFVASGIVITPEMINLGGLYLIPDGGGNKIDNLPHLAMLPAILASQKDRATRLMGQFKKAYELVTELLLMNSSIKRLASGFIKGTAVHNPAENHGPCIFSHLDPNAPNI